MEQRYTQGIRAMLITASILLFIALVIGFVWSWIIALSFIIGSTFFALSCFLSYYFRTTFCFNSIADTNTNFTVAFITNSIAKRDPPPHPGSELEHFKPFTFKQDKEKELEDTRVRALLRQVFPDEEAS